MKKIALVLFVLAILPLGIGGVNAGQHLVVTVKNGCRTKIDISCYGV